MLRTMDHLSNKLHCLKREVHKWVKEQRIANSRKLECSEASLRYLFNLDDPLFTSEVRKNQMLELEPQKRDLYKAQDIAWRLKIRAIWVEAGDRDSVFFHRFASMRWKENGIWSIIGEGGSVFTS